MTALKMALAVTAVLALCGCVVDPYGAPAYYGGSAYYDAPGYYGNSGYYGGPGFGVVIGESDAHPAGDRGGYDGGERR